jgi:hypothetical protein
MRGAALAPLIALLTALPSCAHGHKGYLQSGSGQPLLGPKASAAGTALVAELVLGVGRPSDSLTFGEWARRAYAALCPDLGPSGVQFHAGIPTFDRAHAEVEITFRPGISGQRQATCSPVPPTLRIARVRLSDGAVLDPAPTSTSNDPRVDWLQRFRKGDPAPA